MLGVASGKRLPDTIPHTRYCSLAWQPDGTGFYYTRFPAAGEVPADEQDYHQHVYYHRLGDDWPNDLRWFGAGRDMTEQVMVQLSPNGRWLIISAFVSDVQSAIYVCDLASPSANFMPITASIAALFSAEVNGDHLYLLTSYQAPRYRILALDLFQPSLQNWREIIPQRTDCTIRDFCIVGATLIVEELHNACSQVRAYSLGGEEHGVIDLPSLGAVTALGGA